MNLFDVGRFDREP